MPTSVSPKLLLLFDGRGGGERLSSARLGVLAGDPPPRGSDSSSCSCCLECSGKAKRKVTSNDVVVAFHDRSLELEKRMMMMLMIDGNDDMPCCL